MSSSNNTNKTNVPEAKEAMNRFKMEVANEIGVPLSEGYNGNLTSAQAGSVGGYMVKKMIEEQEKKMAGNKIPAFSACRACKDRGDPASGRAHHETWKADQ